MEKADMKLHRKILVLLSLVRLRARYMRLSGNIIIVGCATEKRGFFFKDEIYWVSYMYKIGIKFVKIFTNTIDIVKKPVL